MYSFTIDDAKEKQWLEWRAEHEKTCPAKPDVSGACYTICFTPNGLGDSITVKCPCGGNIYLDAGDENL